MKIAILLSLFVVSFSLNCLNHDNKPVDWWIMLKMPKIPSVFPDGDNYYYCDSDDNCMDLQFGQYSVKSQDAPFLKSVATMIDAPIQLIWNDQTYDGSVMFDHAHSKGLIAGNDDGEAVIINHSLPKFPQMDGGNIKLQYPNNALTYGQHIFCVQTTLDEVEKIASAYIVAETNVFSSRMSGDYESQYPNLYVLSQQKFRMESEQNAEVEDLQDGQFIKNMFKRIRLLQSNYNSKLSFTSRNGQYFSFFTKNQKNLIDFYETIVAPGLDTGLAVETWGNGAGGLEDPKCEKGEESLSNLIVHFTDERFYKYSKDHSKYAISTNSRKPYLCISDINRQTSQHKRGGTAICFESKSAWSTINSIFKERQSC